MYRIVYAREMSIRALIGDVRIIPVLTIRNPATAVSLGHALAKGGLTVLEVTLRTAAALDAVQAMVAELPEAVVGVGTVTRPEQFEEVARIGAKFAVSPGLTPALAEAAAASGLAYLPGVATVSEALAARERGLSALKFFPAEQAGGIGALKAIAPVLPEIAFCPTGGVTAKNVLDYLRLPNVFAVGGSWVAPQDLVEAEAWDQIRKLAEAAAGSAKAR